LLSELLQGNTRKLETLVKAARKARGADTGWITLREWAAEKCLRKLAGKGFEDCAKIWTAGNAAVDDVQGEVVAEGAQKQDIESSNGNKFNYSPPLRLYTPNQRPDVSVNLSRSSSTPTRSQKIPGAFDEYLWSEDEEESIDDQADDRSLYQSIDTFSQTAVEVPEVGAHEEEEIASDEEHVIKLCVEDPALRRWVERGTSYRKDQDKEVDQYVAQVSELRAEIARLRPLVQSQAQDLTRQHIEMENLRSANKQADLRVNQQREELIQYQKLLESSEQANQRQLKESTWGRARIENLRDSHDDLRQELLRLIPTIIFQANTVADYAKIWWSEISGKCEQVMKTILHLQQYHLSNLPEDGEVMFDVVAITKSEPGQAQVQTEQVKDQVNGLRKASDGMPHFHSTFNSSSFAF
jgi:hypothetical protein